jgi:hypothetical protein
MVEFNDRRDGRIRNINNPDQFGSPKEQAEESLLAMGLQGVRDPEHGTVHVDVSDPKHSFWKKMWED